MMKFDEAVSHFRNGEILLKSGVYYKTNFAMIMKSSDKETWTDAELSMEDVLSDEWEVEADGNN